MNWNDIRLKMLRKTYSIDHLLDMIDSERVCWGGGPPMGQVCACVRRDLRICALLEEPETDIVYLLCAS